MGFFDASALPPTAASELTIHQPLKESGRGAPPSAVAEGASRAPGSTSHRRDVIPDAQPVGPASQSGSC